ncbi:helix-turn-helix domain-containing protein [Paenibacillus thalictri]|uniref:AraC family transcriptional regulator n=1 Tax=Paenibacillus thalictri TaxID=2527873 RepID=A0A4Q9DSK8_9BACL|nr:helix-turn-helix domain-containing protein [Paenibacillus thalictri]TBL78945.1 AraC family transcriptional regulator [Paenibacillus thalictri]
MRWYSRISKLYYLRKFFLRLLLYSVFLAIIPNIALSIMTDQNVTTVFRQESSDKNSVLLTQMKHFMEILVHQIQDNCKQVILNQSFRNFESFPNGYYYEKLSGYLKTEDLPTNYSYLRNKQEAVASINLFKISNPFVDTVYYYDQEKSIVLSFGGETLFQQFDFDSFYDKDWFEPLNKGDYKGLIFLDTRAAMQETQKKKDVITLIIRSNVTNAFIINLDVAKLQEQIVSRLSEQDKLLIVSRDGGLIFKTDEENTARGLLDMVEGEPRFFDNEDITLVKENMLITRTFSPELGWSFINFASMDRLENGLNYLKNQIILSTALLIGAALLVAILSSRSLYRPLRQVVDTLRGQKPRAEGGVPPEQLKDELTDIKDYVQLTAYEKNQIIDKLRESLPYYREKFILSLIKPHTRSAEELAAKLGYLGIDFWLGPSICLVLSIDDYNVVLEAENPQIADLYRLKALQLLQETNCLGENMLTAEVEDDKLAIIMSMKELQLDQLFLLAEDIIQMLQQAMGGSFTIGVGSPCKDITGLPGSFHGAAEALQYRFVYGGSQVIFIEEVSLSVSEDLEGFSLLSNQYMSCIKLGKTEEAKQTLAAMVDNLKDKRIHYNEARSLFVQLLQSLQHGVLALGGKTDALFGPNPYRELAAKQRVEDLLAWFENLTVKVIQAVSEELTAKGSNHITKLLDIIEHDLNQDLSLNAVAGRLSLNPSYVSRLFKQFVGETFVDYVTAKRIERGKQLLESTELKIGEIAANVGYQNAYYFIKLFKEATGMTPGEYRKSSAQR